MIRTLSKDLYTSFLRFKKCLFRAYSSKINDQVAMSSGDEGLIAAVKEFVPKLTSNLHKGQCGRIGIVGGSLEYTGAPYFSAISAMKLGADLVYVFCCKDAASVIKSYSPELIVHPVLDDVNGVVKIEPWLDRLHALVIGPGLGRDEDVLNTVSSLISRLKSERNGALPLIIDADGLHLITQNISLLKDYPGVVILTPNAIEYSRLNQKLSATGIGDTASQMNAVIVKKGQADVICNGLGLNKLQLSPVDSTVICDVIGSNRRCGGQGDILSGVIAVFVAWFQIHKQSENINDKVLNDLEDMDKLSHEKRIALYNEILLGYSLAAYAGCFITKNCSLMAFSSHGRSMTATDMINYIHTVFDSYFEVN